MLPRESIVTRLRHIKWNRLLAHLGPILRAKYISTTTAPNNISGVIIAGLIVAVRLLKHTQTWGEQARTTSADRIMLSQTTLGSGNCPTS